MSSSGSLTHGTGITPDHPTLFGDTYGNAATSDDSTAFLDAIFHPYPASGLPVSSLQEEFDQENQMTYNGDYDSDFGRYWGEELFSYDYSSDGVGADYGGSLVGAEETFQTEEHYDPDFSYQGSNETQPAFDYNNCYESCSRFVDEIFNHNEEEPRPAFGYSLEEIGFCESLFGYWPCVVREMRQPN